MKRLRFGSNFVIFLLFFGVAVVEAIQTQNWLKAGFWMLIGVVFFAADNFRKAND